MVLYFLKYHGRQLTWLLTTRSLGQLVTALLFIGLFISLATGFGWLLVAGFSAVEDDTFLRVALPYFLYELFLLVLCGLVGASALISGTFALFRQAGDQWFMVSPRYQQLLVSKALSVGVFSLWPLVVVALPLLVAMVVVYDIGFGGLALGLVLVAALGLLTTMSALTWLLALGYAAVGLARQWRTTKPFSWFLGGVVTTIVGTAYFVWQQLSGLDIFTLFAVRDFSIVEAPVTAIAQFFELYPSHIAATGFFALQSGTLAVALGSVLYLAGAVFGVSLLYALLGRGFLPLWQQLQEARFVATADAADRLVADEEPEFAKTKSPLRALVQKEFALFKRAPRDLFWLGFLVLLWLVVTSFDIFLVENVDETPLAAVSTVEWIQAMQFLVITYFGAALTLRFAFPAMSTERDHMWVLLSAPISRRSIFGAKAVVYVGLVVALTGLVTIVHLLILPTTLASALSFIGFGAVASFTIGLVGLGIGAYFPNFSSVDPQQLSTSVPGLAFMGLAIGYGVGGAFMLFQWFATDSVLYPILFLLLSLVSCWLVYHCIVRRLAQVEFVGVTHS
jgi:ABC-2 type transport system permease protein